MEKPQMHTPEDEKTRQRYATRAIVRLALLEATAVVGFLAAMMTGDGVPYTIFAALGIATILASLNDEPSAIAKHVR